MDRVPSNARFVPFAWWSYQWMRYNNITLSMLLWLCITVYAVSQFGPYGIFISMVSLAIIAILCCFEIIFGRVMGPTMFGFLVTWIVDVKGADWLGTLLEVLSRGT